MDLIDIPGIVTDVVPACAARADSVAVSVERADKGAGTREHLLVQIHTSDVVGAHRIAALLELTEDR